MNFKTRPELYADKFAPYFRNRIINGDFSIWQRGTSFTFDSAGNRYGYSADRMYSNTSSTSGAVFTVSKTTLNGKNAIRIEINTPPTDLSGTNWIQPLQYRFEGQHLYDLAINNKTITISFWFNSNVSGDFSVALRNSTNITSDIQQSYVTYFKYTTPNTPQKVEIIIPLNAIWNPPLVNDNNMGFLLDIAMLGYGTYITPASNIWINGNHAVVSTAVNWASTSGNFIEIAELQLEEGDTATDFEYVPYDIQLIRCMRYYEVFDNLCGCSVSFLDGFHFPGDFVYSFKVEKRAVPSFSFTVNSASSTTYLIHTITTKGITVDKPYTGNPEHLYFSKVMFDAEL